MLRAIPIVEQYQVLLRLIGSSMEMYIVSIVSVFACPGCLLDLASMTCLATSRRTNIILTVAIGPSF